MSLREAEDEEDYNNQKDLILADIDNRLEGRKAQKASAYFSDFTGTMMQQINW